MGGMMMSFTSDPTTLPSAAPMMTPMARARALVLSRNARNSPITSIPPRRRRGGLAVRRTAPVLVMMGA